MKKMWLIMALATSLIFKMFAQDCYTPNWTGNGLDQMNLYVTGITLNGETLAQPAQIGVFDGDECVAIVDYESAIPTSGFLAFKASADDSTTPELDGFISGNNMSFKLCLGSNAEVTEITATYSSGNGVFAQSGTAVFTLEAKQNSAPEVANEIDDQSFEEGFVSQLIDISNCFNDAEDDPLTITATSSDETVVTVELSGSELTITETGMGEALITLTASDGSLSVEMFINIVVSTTTVISKENYNFKLDLYPNPTKGIVHLKSSKEISSDVVVRVTDSGGATLKVMELNGMGVNITETIDISELYAGIYFINLENKDINTTVKVVKQ